MKFQRVVGHHITVISFEAVKVTQSYAIDLRTQANARKALASSNDQYYTAPCRHPKVFYGFSYQ